jgi:hypothetical protein
MGLLGMFGGFIPVVQYVTGILSLVAIFVGASQRKRLKDANLPNGKATAGMVLGIIAVLITVISIVIAGMFLNSLFGSSKPKSYNNYSYVAPVTPVAPKSEEINLNGRWLEGNLFFIFSGENITLSEKINNKYRKRYQGHFTKTKDFDTPASYIKNKDTEKYTFIFTKEWRNNSWEELTKPVEYVSRISMTRSGILKDDEFSLSGELVSSFTSDSSLFGRNSCTFLKFNQRLVDYE